MTQLHAVCGRVPGELLEGSTLRRASVLQELAANGRLGTLRVDDLKAYLRAKGLKLAGKKDELIARVAEAEGVPMGV
jgi:hypothetical protein